MATPTGILFYDPRPKPLSTVGLFQPGSYYLFYSTGTTTPANVYADGGLTVPLSQTPGVPQPSCTADSAGRFNPIYLNPTTIYRVQLYNAVGALLEDTDPYVVAGAPTGASLAALLFPQTAAEEAAGVVPVNDAIPSHVQLGYMLLERYVAAGTNTGTVDMGVALNNAILIALSTSGGGKYGIPIRFQAGAYLFNTQPNFGALTGNIVPVDIGGEGVGTQLINALAAGKPLFAMDGVSGWWLHDFLMCGSDTYLNNGIRVNSIGGAGGIEWRISRVLAMMAGIGFYVADTNTGLIEDCSSWPGNNPALIIAQTASAANRSHGIYMTGNFVHNVEVRSGIFNSNSNYGIVAGVSTMRGIKMDCAFSYGVVIDGAPLSQTLSGNNNEIGPDIAPTSSAQNLKLTGMFGEGSTVRLSNITNSIIGPITSGNVAGGALRLDGTCRLNTIQGVNAGILDITDASGASQGNTFIACAFYLGAAAYNAGATYTIGNYVSSGGVQYRCIATTTGNAPPNVTYWTVCQMYNDAEEAVGLSAAPNRIIGSGVNANGALSFVGDSGTNWRKILPYAATMTSNVLGPSHNIITVTNATPFTVTFPANQRNGAIQIFTIRNASGGAMGAITWFGGVTGWVNPANGFNRSVALYYDSDLNLWRVLWIGTIDQPN